MKIIGLITEDGFTDPIPPNDKLCFYFYSVSNVNHLVHAGVEILNVFLGHFRIKKNSEYIKNNLTY